MSIIIGVKDTPRRKLALIRGLKTTDTCLRATGLIEDGGWKSGTVWHKLSLIPLALSAPSPEQRWVLLSELDAADSAGGGSGRDRCLIS